MLVGPEGTLSRLGFLSAVAGPRFSPSARRRPFGPHDLFVSALQGFFASSSRLSHLTAAAPPSLVVARLFYFIDSLMLDQSMTAVPRGSELDPALVIGENLRFLETSDGN